mgnify:CR=1 FL=1
MYKSYSMELAGRTLTVDIGRVAKQANGAALMHYGDTTVLATATASKEPREGIDFFPLSVEYEEKMYASRTTRDGLQQEERVRQASMQSLHPVLSTVRCVRCFQRITEMT